MNTPCAQIIHGIVDLIQGVALGYQVVQVELTALIPAHEGGKIAIRPAEAASGAGVGALANTQFLEIDVPRFLSGSDQTGRTAFFKADTARPSRI